MAVGGGGGGGFSTGSSGNAGVALGPLPMTLFLASVRDDAEAEIALEAGADIVDLKEPSRGALGAVDPSTITATVRTVAGRASRQAPRSAMSPCEERWCASGCGDRRVRSGLRQVRPPARGRPAGCLERCARRRLAARLIVVLFADRLPLFDAVAAASRIGAAGIMLDTAGKDVARCSIICASTGLPALWRPPRPWPDRRSCRIAPQRACACAARPRARSHSASVARCAAATNGAARSILPHAATSGLSSRPRPMVSTSATHSLAERAC